MKKSSNLIFYAKILIVMLFLGIVITNQYVMAEPIDNDSILRSRIAFAAVDEKIEHLLNLGKLSEQDLIKLRGPVK